jgi:predicted Co/Zn/Cd cation transporter (cation efflux family)
LNRLRRGDIIAVLAIVAALVLAIFAIAAGADAVALVLGIAISLAAAALIVVLWWVPSRRATRRAERNTHREIIE